MCCSLSRLTDTFTRDVSRLRSKLAQQILHDLRINMLRHVVSISLAILSGNTAPVFNAPAIGDPARMSFAENYNVSHEKTVTLDNVR